MITINIMSSTLKPYANRILLKVEEKEAKTDKDILIPDKIQEKYQKGKVIAIGTGKKNKIGYIAPTKFKVGETVLFSKYEANEIKMNDGTYFLIIEKNILASYR
uniref:Co-chaperonin GroES n=1 Tax=Glaucocystis incrassata TaxID=1789788 RepID=A0A3G1IVC6_9EUKA|nr:co-chaperonin GroES [Glaucocystis incrassata]ASQ39991.1 co-chaperonin GroES [Glaucocystis incrassata]